MSIVAEFSVDSRILQTALGATSRVHLRFEGFQSVGDVIRLHCWVDGDDLDQFEGALEEDPTVADSRRFTARSNCRLYEVRYSDLGADASLYPALVAANGFTLDGNATGDGWRFRCRFPDRDALVSFHDGCEEQGYHFDLASVYGEDASFPTDPFGLTDAQRDTLMTAYEQGYFDVPRGTTLGEVGSRLDVSEQAVSVRLRRGLSSLLGATLVR